MNRFKGIFWIMDSFLFLFLFIFFQRLETVWTIPRWVKIIMTVRRIWSSNAIKVFLKSSFHWICTLQGTEVSPPKGIFEDDFPFPVWWDMWSFPGGYTSGIFQHKRCSMLLLSNLSQCKDWRRAVDRELLGFIGESQWRDLGFVWRPGRSTPIISIQ